jgi:hypothetical protein
VSSPDVLPDVGRRTNVFLTRASCRGASS